MECDYGKHPRSPGGEAVSDEQKALVQQAVAGIAARMRVDLADGYRLAAKVALAALEPTDGAVYSNNFASHEDVIRRHFSRIVKQKLEEAAEAWNIDMEEKS
jgi:ribosomal protein S3AE